MPLGYVVREPEVFERHKVREPAAPLLAHGKAWRRADVSARMRPDGTEAGGTATPGFRVLPDSRAWRYRTARMRHLVLALPAGFRRTEDAGVART